MQEAGHKISDCKKLKDKNRASQKTSGEGESSGSGAAFPACLVAHCDCSDNASDRSDASSHTSAPVLSLHNPIDILGDLDFLTEEIVDELMYGDVQAEAASGEVRGKRKVHAGRFPYLRASLSFILLQSWISIRHRNWIGFGTLFPGSLWIQEDFQLSWCTSGQIPVLDLSTTPCMTWVTMMTMGLGIGVYLSTDLLLDNS